MGFSGVHGVDHRQASFTRSGVPANGGLYFSR
jgi:hypothetical protein